MPLEVFTDSEDNDDCGDNFKDPLAFLETGPGHEWQPPNSESVPPPSQSQIPLGQQPYSCSPHTERQTGLFMDRGCFSETSCSIVLKDLLGTVKGLPDQSTTCSRKSVIILKYAQMVIIFYILYGYRQPQYDEDSPYAALY